MPKIITCTVNSRCTSVLAASVDSYCPEAGLVIHKVQQTTFGESFNAAMTEAFEADDEIIIANDDVVLTPSSYRLLMEDVEILKAQYGDRIGFVAAHTDSAFPAQNIRFQHGSNMDRYRCQWEWEKAARAAEVVAPIFAWISKKAFEAAQFPPLNWYSDDVICRDLGKQGFVHFISRAYVHHVGSQTVGHDDGNNSALSLPWLRANRPDYADMWFGPERAEDPPKKPKICVYAISKNEEQFVERFVRSARDADLILVADTGSEDGTVEACERLGVHVVRIHISPWRFDSARNAALALIPADFDICVSLDLDEVLEPGWREEIERVWTPSTTRLIYFYDWGNGLRFKYEKIHARKGYHWHHPCHEYPRPDLRVSEVWAETDMLLVRHLPDPTKSRGQYLDLLELSVKEDPHCPRNAFYYAREMSFYGKWNEAIDACQKYLAMPEAIWADERAYAHRVIGLCRENLRDVAGAEAAYWAAVAEAPWAREPHVALAQLYHNQGNWAACYASAHRALVFKEPKKVYTTDPKAWGSWPHDLLAIAAWKMGFREEALANGEIAASLEPGNKRLQENLLWFRGEKE